MPRPSRRPFGAPLDQAINGVDGMLYLRSASAGNGALAMTVTFAIGTDPDLAAINVNNRVQGVLSTLPEEVRRQGVQVRKRSTSFLKILALDSDDPRFDAVFISNYALLNIVDELRRIPGVGDVQIFGCEGLLDPDLAASRRAGEARPDAGGRRGGRYASRTRSSPPGVSARSRWPDASTSRSR